MKNFIYVIAIASLLVACGSGGGNKKKANGGTVAVTPTSHQEHICDELLPAQLAITEYNLDRNRVYHDRFYDSQGQSYKHRNVQYNQYNQYNGQHRPTEFVNLYTRDTYQCNRLYAIDDYIEYRYGIPRACADYTYDTYSGRYIHKYHKDTYVNYDHQRGGHYMPDNTQLDCRLNIQGQFYRDHYYYGLFYSFQANLQTGYYGNYSFQSGGNGSFKDLLKAGVLFGIGAAIINAVNK